MNKRSVFGFILGFCLQSSAQSTEVVSLEPATNRPGMDYTHFQLEQANPGLCQQACSQDTRCKAFTYVKPDMRASRAMCWLKQGIPAAVADDCCVSGIKSQDKTIKGEPSPLTEMQKIQQKSDAGGKFKKRPTYQKLEKSFYAHSVGTLWFRMTEQIYCDPGYKIMGGGCELSRGVINITKPIQTGDKVGWQCSVSNKHLEDKTYTLTLKVHAICMLID